MAFKQETVAFLDGYDIGVGVAMATGSPMALGAMGAITPPEIGTGGSGSFTFRRIDSTEELETELGIGADVSAGIGLFSGSASFDFSRKCRIQSSSLAVLVSAEERFAFQQMDSPKLTEPAAVLVENGKTEQFANQFGEYFVRGIRTGGRFFGVVRIDTRSVESKTTVDTELRGAYGLTVSAEVRLKISEALKNANAKIEAFIVFDGGHVTTRPTSRDPITLLEQLYKAMDEWTATVRTEPKAYSVTLAPYIIALGPTPPNIVDIEHQRDVLIRCARLRSRTMDSLNLIEYMLHPDHRNEFEAVPAGGPDLSALQAALAGDLDAIADAASFAINNLKDACDPETFMRKIKGVQDFRLTSLPTNLPKHVGDGGPSLRVEEFGGRWETNDNGKFRRLTIFTGQNNSATADFEIAKEPNPIFKVVSSEGHIEGDALVLTLQVFLLLFGTTMVFTLRKIDPVRTAATIREVNPVTGETLTDAAVFVRVF